MLVSVKARHFIGRLYCYRSKTKNVKNVGTLFDSTFCVSVSFFFWLSSELGLAISFLRKMLHSPKWWLRICSITAKLFWKKELFRSFRPIDGRLKPSHPFLIGSLLGISSKSHIQKYCIFQLEWLRSNTSRTSKAWEILNNFFALVLSCKIFRFGLEELKCPLWKLQLSR